MNDWSNIKKPLFCTPPYPDFKTTQEKLRPRRVVVEYQNIMDESIKSLQETLLN